MEYCLYHHGIKGQKWGVRRWQNADGSLTAAGRSHYGIGKAINRIKYGKTYDTELTENVKTSFGKTKYTNMDGTLNEKGKVLASNFIGKEVERTKKYYGKKEEKYKKAAEDLKDDDPKAAETFRKMAESARKSALQSEENLKNLSMDQIVAIQQQRDSKKFKIAAGIAGTIGAAGLVDAVAKNADKIKIGVDEGYQSFLDFDPDIYVNKLLEKADTSPLVNRGMQYANQALTGYFSARSYVKSAQINTALAVAKETGVVDNIANMVGDFAATASKETATSMDRVSSAVNRNAESLGTAGAKFASSFLANTDTTSINTTLNSIANAMNTASNLSNSASGTINAGRAFVEAETEAINALKYY